MERKKKRYIVLYGLISSIGWIVTGCMAMSDYMKYGMCPLIIIDLIFNIITGINFGIFGYVLDCRSKYRRIMKKSELEKAESDREYKLPGRHLRIYQ